MKLKSYFSASIGEAVERARLELGPDAMLLNSRKLAAEQLHLGAYEVVFGVGAEVPPAAGKFQASVPSPIPKTPGDSLADEMAEIRRQLETMKHSIAGAAAGRWQPPRYPELEAFRGNLLEGGFSATLAAEIIDAAEKQLNLEPTQAGNNSQSQNQSTTNTQSVDRTLLAEIERRFEVKPELGKGGTDKRVVMLVGPPGAGKTTTLVKLAVKCGISTRTPLRILSTDTLRVGGTEPLATYARIIGVAFDEVHSMVGLDQALEESQNKRLILIDTPGFGPADMDEAAQLAAFVNTRPGIEVQLVLPAYLRSAAFKNFCERFEIFAPSKLLFTHLDEIETYGGILEHAMKTGLPISYLTNGQSVPQDILDAAKPFLTGWITTRSSVATFSVA